ncbi:MAG: sensory rhodopsin transducer [Armatimonadota bacterium]
MAKGGARIWYFPDGYLPEKTNNGAMEAHEALMLLNCGNSPAQVKLDFYFEDKDPVRDVAVTVDAERVRTLRLDHPEDIGGSVIPPLTQYSIRVRSDVDIVVQFGRLDTTQNNMAYYCGIGYCAE